MPRSVVELYRYPVKGLSAERLPALELTRDHGLRWDREFAIALGSTSFDPDHPEPLDKGFFLMLRNNETLAALETKFDPATGTLTILEAGKPVLSANLTTAAEREMVEIFFAGYIGAAAKGRPRVVRAEGHKFTDASVMSPVMMRAVSVINLASVRALENAIGAAVDPLRFRGNVYLEGLEPWEELEWVGHDIRIGKLAFRGLERTPRCAAVNVNPRTAQRDLNLPKAIMKNFGHTDLGVYVETVVGGELRIGDTVSDFVGIH
jgi:uncharacterized protein